MIPLFQISKMPVKNPATAHTDDILKKCYNVPRYLTVHSD